VNISIGIAPFDSTEAKVYVWSDELTEIIVMTSREEKTMKLSKDSIAVDRFILPQWDKFTLIHDKSELISVTAYPQSAPEEYVSFPLMAYVEGSELKVAVASPSSGNNKIQVWWGVYNSSGKVRDGYFEKAQYATEGGQTLWFSDTIDMSRGDYLVAYFKVQHVPSAEPTRYVYGYGGLFYSAYAAPPIPSKYIFYAMMGMLGIAAIAMFIRKR